MTTATYTQQPATGKQLAYLRTLAKRTGTTFTMPNSKSQASRQIQAMLKRPVSNQLELALDDVAVRGGDLPDIG